MTRLAIEATGIVQGVGMRPFVHRAATERGLVGWVQNGCAGVCIEVQGCANDVHAFLEALRDCPSPAYVAHVQVREIDEQDDRGFRIRDSAETCERAPAIPADLAMCSECAVEVNDPGARRYRYPFTNCARCGPRFTIVVGLPYDRLRTSMKTFTMCSDCASEYESHEDRRFHAEPIACPACGPELLLVSPRDEPIARGDAALHLAADAVRSGRVLALKGIGGFQLLADATNDYAVERLRARKHREAKPFAVMFPSRESLRGCCEVSHQEEGAMASPAAPIVLAQGRAGALAANVAPGNPNVGAMLPYSPLHRLLLNEIGRPVVCTSGNLSDEPIAIDNAEAIDRLGGIADALLVHDRPVLRPADDSVGRVGPDGFALLRRARGYAPLPVRLAEHTPVILALGAQLKSTVALALGGQVVVSQHLGDLHSVDGARLLERICRDLLAFYGVVPQVIACDLHPDYTSTLLAERLATQYGVPVERIQHHHAHVAACIAEHGLTGPVLGVAWDGGGYGTDGAIWGGEFLVCNGAHARRAAHLRPFSLPGGEQAVKEPRRAAFGVLHELLGERAVLHAHRWFSQGEATVLQRLMARSIRAPRTTSAGRLFDAVTAIVGIRDRNRFEGDAASALEFAAEGVDTAEPYPGFVRPDDPAVVDWEPLVSAILEDSELGCSPSTISARFHEGLAALVEDVAARLGVQRVVLTGGCFQNALLTRRTCERLRRRGLHVYTPRSFPPNDGGISLGQVLVASRRFLSGGAPCA